MGQIIASGIDATTNSLIASMNVNAQKYASDRNYQSVVDTNRANKAIADSVNQTNRELANQQNQWNLDQWNRENSYNTPQNQVRRLMGAGLSSAAAAQSVDGAGNAGAIQSAELANQQAYTQEAPQVTAPQFDINAIPSILGIMRELVALRKDSAEADMSEAKSGVLPQMLLTDMDVKRADADLKRQEYTNIMKSFPYTLRSLRYKSKADALLPELNRAAVEKTKTEKELVSENAKLARQQFGFLNDWNELKIKEVGEQIKNLAVQRQNLLKEGKKIDADTENAKKYGKILDEKGYQEEIETIYKKAGAPDDFANRVGVLIANGVISPNNLDVMTIGLKDYVKAGHRWLGSDPATRDFLYYYWDKGSQNKSRFNPANFGYAHSLFDGLSNFFGK